MRRKRWGSPSPGGGPLQLLTAGRVANALAAVLLLALAVRWAPVGKLAFALGGLLPMALFEYGSVAADGPIVGTALLFTALALRARQEGGWTAGGFGGVVACGLVFCVAKPGVYAPLLLLPAPLLLASRARTSNALFQAALLVVVLGCSAAWMRYASSSFVLQKPNLDVAGQAASILRNPGAFATTFALTSVESGFYIPGAIGKLGWLTIRLPTIAYALAVAGLLLCPLAEPRSPSPQPRWWGAWDLLLAFGSYALILTTLYLYWNPVGFDRIHGVQGRYLLPLLGAVSAALCTVVRPHLTDGRRAACTGAILAIILFEVAVTVWTVTQAYGTFYAEPAPTGEAVSVR